MLVAVVPSNPMKVAQRKFMQKLKVLLTRFEKKLDHPFLNHHKIPLTHQSHPGYRRPFKIKSLKKLKFGELKLKRKFKTSTIMKCF